jgi:AcrR family transcriptional regulator
MQPPLVNIARKMNASTSPLLSAQLAPAGAKARDRILSSAYELFARHGIRAVGIDAIIEHSGVARMTLYRHFASKDELVLAFLERRDALWSVAWLQAEVERRAKKPVERLLAIFDVIGEWFKAENYEGCSFINVMLETTERSSAVRAATVMYLERVRQFLEQLAVQAEISDAAAFSRKWQLLMNGSIVAASAGDRAAAQHAREVGALAIAAASQMSIDRG